MLQKHIAWSVVLIPGLLNKMYISGLEQHWQIKVNPFSSCGVVFQNEFNVNHVEFWTMFKSKWY